MILLFVAAMQLAEPPPVKVTVEGRTFTIQPLDDRPLPACIEYVQPDGSIDCYFWQRPAAGKEDRK